MGLITIHFGLGPTEVMNMTLDQFEIYAAGVDAVESKGPRRGEFKMEV